MIDKNAHHARTNYSSSSNISKSIFDEELLDILRSYVSSNDISRHLSNVSWNNTSISLDNSNVNNDLIPSFVSCHLISPEEIELHQNIDFYLEIIFYPIWIFIALAFNTIAIKVLRRWIKIISILYMIALWTIFVYQQGLCCESRT